jgi:hypothetical protein
VGFGQFSKLLQKTTKKLVGDYLEQAIITRKMQSKTLDLVVLRYFLIWTEDVKMLLQQ